MFLSASIRFYLRLNYSRLLFALSRSWRTGMSALPGATRFHERRVYAGLCVSCVEARGTRAVPGGERFLGGLWCSVFIRGYVDVTIC